mmetsp:Transcript_130/g.213  ORF Transcript_130/g.213 Transcript_130/m.213 type:complete len:348 (-) Transcript_130:33-1076(-)
MESVLLAALSRPIHGTNPMNLVETIVRKRIVESAYWQQYCFAMNEALLVERASELIAAGGVSSENNTPTPFLCLTLKLLQMAPEKEIVLELLQNGEFKYMRALAAFYIRLTGSPKDIYILLEPLYSEYSKLRIQHRTGWTLSTMDQFIHTLLTEDYACDIALPRLPERQILVQNNVLQPYVSPFAHQLMEDQDSEVESEIFQENSHNEEEDGGNNAALKRPRNGSRSGDEEAGKEIVKADPRLNISEPDAREKVRKQRKKDQKERKSKRSRKDAPEKKIGKDTKKKSKSKKSKEEKTAAPKPKLFIKGLKSARVLDGSLAGQPRAEDVSSTQAQNELRASVGLAPLK